MDPLLPDDDGHTPLTDEDLRGLIPTYIATRGELFDAEQGNIARALLRLPPTVTRLLDDKYLRELHQVMFNEVWTWAGRYRVRETNIGFDPIHIATAVRNLVADVKTWIELEAYGPDEVAIRFHHRLVQIHPFPNGNGRHARIAADYLVSSMDQRPFSWGRNSGLDTATLRANYLRSLRQADRSEIGELLGFART
ncbi:MAG: mobile mystery protein B [Acidimicrobiia bacterium]|nr:mobile mystery protein B [Acidimicrobiia bacterium]